MAGKPYSLADAKQIADAPDVDPTLYLDPFKFSEEVALLEHYMDRCSEGHLPNFASFIEN